jgi:hypothetical protein
VPLCSPRISQSGLGLNSGVHGEAATNRLNHGTALVKLSEVQVYMLHYDLSSMCFFFVLQVSVPTGPSVVVVITMVT